MLVSMDLDIRSQDYVSKTRVSGDSVIEVASYIPHYSLWRERGVLGPGSTFCYHFLLPSPDAFGLVTRRYAGCRELIFLIFYSIFSFFFANVFANIYVVFSFGLDRRGIGILNPGR